MKLAKRKLSDGFIEQKLNRLESILNASGVIYDI